MVAVEVEAAPLERGLRGSLQELFFSDATRERRGGGTLRRYVCDRFLPDKAIDLIDQASARVRLRTRTKDDETRSLEEDFRWLARERDQATPAEDYDRAGDLRDQIESRRSDRDDRRKGRQSTTAASPTLRVVRSTSRTAW